MDTRKTRRGMVVVGGRAFYAEALVFISGQTVVVRPVADDANKVAITRLEDGADICLAAAIEEVGNGA